MRTAPPCRCRARVVINAAGLDADRIAQTAGIDLDAAGYRIHPAKGEYFRVSSRHRGKLGRLVYPVPSPVHLGAHAVLGLDNGLKIGPGSISAALGDYTVDPSHAGRVPVRRRRGFFPSWNPATSRRTWRGYGRSSTGWENRFGISSSAKRAAAGCPGW